GFSELREMRWLAACLWYPDAVLSHRTAAAIHEFDGLDEIDDVELSAPRGRGSCPDGVRLYKTGALPDEDRRVVRGLAVTSKARTLFDLAAVIEEEQLAYALEAARKHDAVPLDWVRRRLHQLRKQGRAGVEVLQRVVDDCELRGVRLQSALEVRFWRRVRDAGLPLPLCQLPFGFDDGQPGWIDFAWPAAKLAVETRGAQFHAAVEAFEFNSRRTARLTAEGWSVMPITWSMLVENEARVMRQVEAALRFRGALPPIQFELL
ncbi:MAG: DUF559 domain-containing protein, partial [Myxococcaceae bacterium]